MKTKPMKHDIMLCADAYRILLGLPPFNETTNQDKRSPSLSQSIDRVFTPATRHQAREIVDAEQWELLNEQE